MEAANEKSVAKHVTDTVKTAKKIKFLVGLLGSKALIIIGLIFFISILIIGMVSSGSSNSGEYPGGVQASNLSETTLQWMDEVTEEATRQGVPDLVPYIMAIIEVESKGTGTADIMQSSESAGLGPNAFTDPKQSIEQGISYLKSGMALGENMGFTDYWGIIQGYNFGMSYVSHLSSSNEKHTTKVAEEYSRTVVAPSLGNSVGTTYSYVNPVSVAYGQTYLYRNGGNYYYADLVRQFVGAGSAELPMGSDTFNAVMNEALKFEGNEYVWAGSHPNTGFDCSGLMQWAFAKAGINLPRTAIEQHAFTEEIPISEAQPGDLIFFKGTYGAPDHISHVGIYIDETRMYDANGSGVGFHYWTDPYWQSHFESIHRIKQ